MTQPTTKSQSSINNIADMLTQQLLLLRQSEKDLEFLTAELNKERDNLDKILQQHIQEWSNHREKYFDQLAAQLEANNIILNAAEKTELRRGSATTSSIQEKLKTLEKMQISLPSKASDFTVVAYDAIIAVLSRTLQKIDSKAVNSIAKQIKAIDDENSASNKLKSDHAKQHEAITAKVKEIENKIIKLPTLSPNQLQLLKQLDNQAKTLAQKKTEEKTE